MLIYSLNQIVYWYRYQKYLLVDPNTKEVFIDLLVEVESNSKLIKLTNVFPRTILKGIVYWLNQIVYWLKQI